MSPNRLGSPVATNVSSGISNPEGALGVGKTTDQLRTTTAEFSASQPSTMDTSDKWFTLDNHGGPTEIFPFLDTYSMISAMIMARFPGSLMTLGQVSPG
jgi:hypothetical protein